MAALMRTYLKNFMIAIFKIIKSEINKSYPRISQTPFSKWYVKAYSANSKEIKIINAILDNTIHLLNKKFKKCHKKCTQY